MFYQQEKIAILVDGPNCHATAMKLEMQIDWKAVNTEFMNRGRLLRSYYFTPIFGDESVHSAMRPLIDWLSYNGYQVITANIEHDSVESKGKARRESTVDITVRAMLLAQTVDHIVLFTGDGMFAPLVQALQDIGTRVTVVSSIEPDAVCCADVLRRQADHFIDLEILREKIEKVRNV